MRTPIDEKTERRLNIAAGIVVIVVLAFFALLAYVAVTFDNEPAASPSEWPQRR